MGTELTHASANILMLDRVLSHYGPETSEAREVLKGAVVRALDKMWSQGRRGHSQVDSGSHGNESLYEKIHELSPKDEAQRSLKSEGLSVAVSLGQTRWLMYEQQATSASKPLVIVMVFWFTIIFVSWGLFAPTNGTVIAELRQSGSERGARYLCKPKTHVGANRSEHTLSFPEGYLVWSF